MRVRALTQTIIMGAKRNARSCVVAMEGVVGSKTKSQSNTPLLKIRRCNIKGGNTQRPKLR